MPPPAHQNYSEVFSPKVSRAGVTVGVEVGYNTLYLARLREAANGVITFDDCRAVGFDPVLELESSAFAAVLKAALQEVCGSSREVAIWAAPKLDRTRLYHVKVPRVNPSRLEGAVYWALKREEPFLDEETVIDFAVDEETGPAAEQDLCVTGALATSADIQGIQRAFSQAGFPLTGIGLPLLALRQLMSLRSRDAADVPVLLCQMGINATNVSVLRGRRLVFSRSISVGLRSLTEALVKELDPAPSSPQASNLVLELGREKGAPQPGRPWTEEAVSLVLRPALERLVRQIEHTIQYYQSTFNSEPIETIYLGGELAARGPLPQLIAEQIGAQVIALDPFDTPHLPSNTLPPKTEAERVAYGPAVGLALSGNGATLNLSRTYRDRQNERKRRRIAWAVFGLLFFLSVASGLFYGWQQVQLRELQATRDNLSQSLAGMGPALNETVLFTAMHDVRALQERRRAAAKRYEGLALLSEIARLTPSHISLIRVTADMGAPIETGAKTTRSLLLEGVVDGERASLETSLTIYVARLDQSPLIQTVEVKSTELVQSPEGLHLAFMLKMEIGKQGEPAAARK